MKKQQKQKKLALNWETLRTLTAEQITDVVGGMIGPDTTISAGGGCTTF